MCWKYISLLSLIMCLTGKRPSSNDRISLVTWLEQSKHFLISDSSTFSSFLILFSVIWYQTSHHDNMDDIRKAFRNITASSKWYFPPGMLLRMLVIVFTMPLPLLAKFDIFWVFEPSLLRIWPKYFSLWLSLES